MTVVLDASAAAEIVFKRSAGVHLREFIGSAEKVITAELYKAEIANTLGKYIHTDLISKEQGMQILDLSLGLIDEFVDIKENAVEALHEAVKRKQPVYDMLYLTLARRTGSLLLTMDTRLAESARDADVTVVP
jgi:predicted nucleic acid-binding protein